MEKVDYIELKMFTADYIDQLSTFELPEDQEQFTALPTKYFEVEEGQHRVVILNHETPVGFFLLHTTERVKQYSNNPNAMLLTSLSINYSDQGKGFAKQAMFLIKRFVEIEFPECDEIVLAVNHRNIAAQKLYDKVGFIDTGRRKMGRIGEQFILNLKIK